MCHLTHWSACLLHSVRTSCQRLHVGRTGFNESSQVIDEVCPPRQTQWLPALDLFSVFGRGRFDRLALVELPHFDVRIILGVFATDWKVNWFGNRLKTCDFNSDRITTVLLAAAQSVSNIERHREPIPVTRQVWKSDRLSVQLAIVIHIIGVETAIQKMIGLEFRGLQCWSPTAGQAFTPVVD